MMIKHALEVNDCFMQLAKELDLENRCEPLLLVSSLWLPINKRWFTRPHTSNPLILHIKSKLLSHMHEMYMLPSPN